MAYENEMKIEFDSRSCNEGFIRVAVSAFLTQLNPTLEEVADVKTAVSEAVTNCIVHAYEGKKEKILVSCHIEGHALYLEIKDHGCGIPDIKKSNGTNCLRQNRMRSDPVWALLLWRLLWMMCA